MTSGEDLGEDVEGLPGCGVEGTRNEADAFVEYQLGARAEGAVFA